jgi:Cu/Ag efflux protein CusF
VRGLFAAFVCVLVLLSCGGKQDGGGPVNRYSLTGNVLSLDKNRIAVIQHEAIKDSSGKVWMDPMTMEFPVKEHSDFARMRVGQRIQATVYQRPSDLEYWIADVRELPEAKESR